MNELPPRLIHEIRAKYPGLAKKADAGSRLSACKLFCIECMGGSLREARSCYTLDCPLWATTGKGWGKIRNRAREAYLGAKAAGIGGGGLHDAILARMDA